MRRLNKIGFAPVLALGLAGCWQDNPVFEECSRDGRCVADDESAGTGEGPEGGTAGDGDGDSDGEPGDGAPGDGDGAPGDGDGDDNGEEPSHPLATLPPCDVEGAEPLLFPLTLAEDTFLVQGPNVLEKCVLAWGPNDDPADFGPTYCKYLDFGGAAQRPLCGEMGCMSVWLGRVDVEVDGWEEFEPTVSKAWINFTAEVLPVLPSLLTLAPFHLGPEVFNPYQDWQAGQTDGLVAEDLVTTWQYAAKPVAWGYQPSLNPFFAQQALPNTPGEHTIEMELPADAVQAWLNQGHHPGMILHSGSSSPNFRLFANESQKRPTIMVELCAP